MQLDMPPAISCYISTEDGGSSSPSAPGRGGHFCFGTARVFRSTPCLELYFFWIITGYTDFREIGKLLEQDITLGHVLKRVCIKVTLA
jgi:hypothetical protein